MMQARTILIAVMGNVALDRGLKNRFLKRKVVVVKIAFASQDNLGKKSSLYTHFGSANFFIIVDTQTGSVEGVVNEDREHLHGKCNPLAALGGMDVNTVVVGGIGAGALRKLRANGISVYRGVKGTIEKNLELVQAGELDEFATDQLCQAHGADGGCSH